MAMLAPLYQQKSDFESSYRLYRQLLKIAPYEASYWAGLAVNLEAMSQQDKAVLAYKRALETGNLSKPLRQYAMQRINHITKLDMTYE